jgi:hypothetical protein
MDKKLERQKQLNEFREDFHKLQNAETKKSIKKEAYEIKKTTQDMKEEYNKDTGSLRKKKSNRNPVNKKSLKST